MRKQIVVDINSTDTHCLGDCPFFLGEKIGFKYERCRLRSEIGKRLVGRIRTAECKKRELACSKNIDVHQK